MFELPPPVIDLQGLSFGHGAVPVLHDCALQLYPAECLAIVGASGSGKSTLLSVLAGRSPLPMVAHYHLAGRDMRADAAREHWRRETGYVGQNAAQMLDLNLSAAGNIARRLLDLGSREAQGVLAQCRDWLHRLGLDPQRLKDPVGQFSGGMQQRVQIAAALVHGPKILFLDEPTTGLDTVSQAGLIDILRQLKRTQDTAMIFVTHDLAVARLIADRVLVMDRGRIVEEALCDRLLCAPSSPAATEIVRAML